MNTKVEQLVVIKMLQFDILCNRQYHAVQTLTCLVRVLCPRFSFAALRQTIIPYAPFVHYRTLLIHDQYYLSLQ